jgi:hypothetical protein
MARLYDPLCLASRTNDNLAENLYVPVGSRILTLVRRRELIYMSIRTEWQRLVAEEQFLWRLSPFQGDPSARTVLLSKEMEELLSCEMDEGEEANRRSRLLASLQHIVAGRRLVVCMIPFKARKAHIGRLCPVQDSIWDIRCQDSPAVRVFCHFLEKDVLLAATCRPRSVPINWLGWLPLGDRSSKEWKRGRDATTREWNKLFPTYVPVSGENLDAYLSNASLE